MKTLQLSSGRTVPALGFGTWQLTGEQCVESVKTALTTGYRHIDTALAYGNHREVARAISGFPREDLHLTSKVPRDELHEDDLVAACKRSLKELDTPYLNLFLIHWPNPDIPIEESLGAMRTLQQDGLIRDYGVSNFTIARLQEALDKGFAPVTNQVEFHVRFNQQELKEFCDDNGMLVTAYSPLGRGQDLDHPILREVADKYEKTPAQVALNWLLSKDMAAVPKSGTERHIQENFGALGWELSPEDVSRIEALDEDERLVNPGFADFA